MKIIFACTLVLALQGCRPSVTPAPSSGTTAAITQEDLRSRLYIIADDSMMGRETGSIGDFKTAAYVAAEFQRLGLEPAGDSGTYFQTVPFWMAVADPASTLSGAGHSYQLNRDFLPVSPRAAARTLDGVRAIYGGTLTDTSTWITPADAAGKVVVLDAIAVPGQAAPQVAPRWRTANTVAVVALGTVGAELIAFFRDGLPIVDTTRNPNGMPVLWITRAMATDLLGGDPSTTKIGALGAEVHGSFVVGRRATPYPARNVVAILRGSDPSLRAEYVSLTAHNDHVGFDHSPVDHDSLRAFNRVIRPMGADSPPREPTAGEWSAIHTLLDSLRRVHRPRLDSIRNGADDDGSGTVAILEIAEAMAKGAGPRPRRSILFVSHTGEEAGLIGSQWFTSHSTVPMDSIVAEIDEDGIGRGTASEFPRDGGKGAGGPTYLEVVGAKRLSHEFGDSLEAVNAREPVPFVFDYTYDAPGHPFQYYCRADHYNYARFGVPSVTLARGEHLDYHQVTDEAQYISYPDLARVTHMVYAAAMAIANMSHRPRLDAAKPTNPNGFCRQ